jgi:hypothetical protein
MRSSANQEVVTNNNPAKMFAFDHSFLSDHLLSYNNFLVLQ